MATIIEEFNLLYEHPNSDHNAQSPTKEGTTESATVVPAIVGITKPAAVGPATVGTTEALQQ